MKLNPKVHHVVSSTTANHAPCVLPRKLGACSPSEVKALVISPVSGVYMNPKISTTMDEGTTNGAKKASLKNHCPRETRTASMAKSSGSSTSSGVLNRVNNVECHMAAQKSPSVRTSP